MRILGFSQKWSKLDFPEFTTFRHTRGDRDWDVGEQVQIVIQPRRKGGGDKLGIAEIIGKELRELDPFFAHVAPLVTKEEAIADGFNSREDMVYYMEKQDGLDYISIFNKLTLRWVDDAGQ